MGRRLSTPRFSKQKEEKQMAGLLDGWRETRQGSKIAKVLFSGEERE